MSRGKAARPSGGPRVISVTSGKGGVGKTNIVGNLALAFSAMGQRVLIIDADLGLANIDIIFNVHPEFNIGHVISGEKQLKDIVVTTDDGIRIIPAGSGLSGLAELTEGQKLNLLSEFESYDDVADIVLIDTGAGISSNVIYFNLAADECIIIVTPEPTSITDAYAMIKVMATQHGAKHFKLLVNMADESKEAKRVFFTIHQAADKFLKGIVIEYLGFIPADKCLKQAVINRKTVVTAYPGSESSRSLKKVARMMLSSPLRQPGNGSVRFFFKQFMESGDGQGR